jgi:hypothetical protein
LAAAIQKAHGNNVQVDLIRGDGGIFDVAIDGDMVFRKWDQHRFPDNKEILDAIEARKQKA